jgi:hypothetical protein
MLMETKEQDVFKQDPSKPLHGSSTEDGATQQDASLAHSRLRNLPGTKDEVATGVCYTGLAGCGAIKDSARGRLSFRLLCLATIEALPVASATLGVYRVCICATGVSSGSYPTGPSQRRLADYYTERTGRERMAL